MGLNYQSNVETGADPSAQTNLWQSSYVIYDMKHSYAIKAITFYIKLWSKTEIGL